MAHSGQVRQDLITELEALLQARVDAGTPGVAAAIHSKGKIIWESAKGLSDMTGNESLHTDHLFGIGSISKVLVAVVILQLVDESKLTLSATVADFLEPEVYAEVENAEYATIERLLTHHAAMGKDIRNDHIWGKTEPLDYIRRPRVTAPESGQPHYSNTNYTLLGLIIEKITDHTAEAELRRRILEPLAGDALSLPFVRSDMIDTTSSELSSIWVAGGYISSVYDLLKFAPALRDGRLLSPEKMAILKDWRPFPSASIEMGHGIFRISFDPTSEDKWVGHSGGVLGFSAHMYFKEEGDVAVSVLSNVGTIVSGAVPSSGVDVLNKTDFLNIATKLAAISQQ